MIQARCSSADAYTVTAGALTSPKTTDVTLTFVAAPGCSAVTAVKHVQVKTFNADGDVVAVKNFQNEDTKDDAVTLVGLDRVGRGLRIETDVQLQTGDPTRTYVLRDATTSKLRPWLASPSGPAWIRVAKLATACSGAPL